MTMPAAMMANGSGFVPPQDQLPSAISIPEGGHGE
jgi:hypothetical protein